MKKYNMLLLLPLSIQLASCQSNATIQKRIMNALLDGFHVSVTGSLETIYPEAYSVMNTHQMITVERDYKNIVESDGRITPAVREQKDTHFTTLFRGENGETVYELLTKENEVKTMPYMIGGNQVLFNEVYGNPFSYIDVTDIDDQLFLNSSKASFILEKLTGYSCAVQQAQFIAKGNKAEALEVTIYDRRDGMQTTGGMMEIINHFSFDIHFTYGIHEIQHLSSRSKADNTLRTAFLDYDNYTVTFESNATSDTMIAYVTQEAILLHHGIHTIGFQNGDIYYKKVAEDSYDQYVYRASSHTFSLQDFGIKKSHILPDISSISPDILIEKSKDLYYFDSYAAPFGMEDFILPSYAVNTGLGIKGVLRLENQRFARLWAYFDPTNPFSITQNYYHYHTTTMPSWFDLALIQ